MRYRHLPTEVDAIQYDGDNADEVLDWIADHDSAAHAVDGTDGLIVGTLHGDAVVTTGDWVLHSAGGGFWPHKDALFAASYTPVQDKAEIDAHNRERMRQLQEQGYSPTDAAKIVGINLPSANAGQLDGGEWVTPANV